MTSPAKQRYLVAVGGPLAAERWQVTADKIFLGRDASVCAVSLPASQTVVSKVHASVWWSSEQRCVLLCDEGSRHGTFVDADTRLTPNEPVSLALNGTFWIGDSNLRFSLVDGLTLEHETTRRQRRVRALSDDDLAELLEGVRQRKNAHVGRLRTLFHARLFDRLRRKYARLSDEAIEDSITDTFMALPGRLIWYEDHGTFEHWLFHLAKNVARTRLRSQKRDNHRFANVEVEGNRDASAIGRVESSEFSALIFSKISELSPSAQEVMKLHMAGVAIEEIATSIGKSRGAVDVALTRAKNQLVALAGLETLVAHLGRLGAIHQVGMDRLLRVFGIDRLLVVFGSEQLLTTYGAQRLLKELGPERVVDLFGRSRIEAMIGADAMNKALP